LQPASAAPRGMVSVASPGPESCGTIGLRRAVQAGGFGQWLNISANPT